MAPLEHADLSSVAGYHSNDMVVRAEGRAYVGNFGYNHQTEPEGKTVGLAWVDSDRSAYRAATGLKFPNENVITPDGNSLVVGETGGNRLTARDIGTDGRLSNRCVWADLGQNFPDSICLDGEGAIWIADPRPKETIRVRESGNVTHRIPTGDLSSYTCVLGGDDSKTQSVCTAVGSGPGATKARKGRIEYCRVEVPGAGRP